MGIYRLGCFLLLLGLFRGAPVRADSAPDGVPDGVPGGASGGVPQGAVTEPEALIGLTLGGLYDRFGVPQAVYAARGLDEWQDDVVLVYPQGDFYVYRDRVWQLGLRAVRGIQLGDSREAVLLALGEEAREGEGYFLLPIYGRSWPITLRVNMGDSALVAGIFVYRSDF
jgi:hypothetical protein